MNAVTHYEHRIVKVKDLIPYANNSRTHTKEQIEQIRASIREWGFTNPVLIDEDSGLIAGHGRLMAAAAEKMKTVPAVVLTGLTEAQKKAYIIADNKLALNAGWDLDMLAVELEDLHDLDFDLGLMGFENFELVDLLPQLGEDYPSMPAEPKEQAADKGELVQALSTSLGKPKFEAVEGGHYHLGPRVVVMVCSVIKDHAIWAPKLKEGQLFIPYAGIFAALADGEPELFIVQPDAYIASVLIDAYVEVHGDTEVIHVNA
jgi:hypothetical protein